MTESSTSSMESYRIIFRASVSFVLKALALNLVIVVLCAIVFVSLLRLYAHLKIGWLLAGILFVFILLSLNVLLYLLRLVFDSRPILTLDRTGLRDLASPAFVGFVRISEIRSMGVRDSLLGEFLKVKLSTSTEALRSLYGLQKWNWRLMNFFGVANCLYIPLEALDSSRMDLETQLMHFGALLKKASLREVSLGSTSSSTTSSKSDVGSYEPPMVPNDPEEASFTLPDPHTSLSEKSQIIQQIEVIKKYVEARRLDQKACDLYVEAVSQFPDWMARKDIRLIQSVSDARWVSRNLDYEEVEFLFEGKKVQFALRRDLGNSEEALLSLAFEGRVKMATRAIVEIGALEPVDIEVFKRGDWEAIFNRLYDLSTSQLELLIRKGLGQGEAAEAASGPHDLEKLKENFGISED